MIKEAMDTIVSVLRGDGWENAVLGIGGSKDPSAYTSVAPRAPLSDTKLDVLYIEDHFAATVVEKLPKTALRAGWEIVVPGDPAQSAKTRDLYRTREDELGVAQELSQGACWGRLYGGAVTWIGADDHRSPALPVDETAIRQVAFLHTFDRRDVQVWSYYQDPGHPKFRKPETFRIFPAAAAAIAKSFGGLQTAGGIVVHETRCVVWGGAPTTDQRRLELAGWDDSVLERCWEPLKQLAEDYAGKSLLLGRISQAIYKIKGLYAMIAGKKEEVLRTRMGLLDASRSRSRAILLDLEEEFVNVAQPMTGLSEALDKSILRLSAAADMPATVLMGQSPAGMDATGEGDLELWYASCDAWRQLELRHRHERITRLVLLAKDGPTGGTEPDGWEIAYRPLRVPKAKELAETRKIEADTFAVYVDKGLAAPEEIALHVFSPSSGKTDFALDESELRAKVARRRELANQPPKDNAELGTVGARASAALDVVAKVAAGEVSRETGLAVFRQFFRLTPEDAAEMLGPETFAPKPTATPPGPRPGPGEGSGAGAPQGLPGFNAGGDPRGEP